MNKQSIDSLCNVQSSALLKIQIGVTGSLGDVADVLHSQQTEWIQIVIYAILALNFHPSIAVAAVAIVAIMDAIVIHTRICCSVIRYSNKS